MRREPSHNALKRVAATLLGMGLTRLELAGLELSQARGRAVQSLAFGFTLVLVLALGSVFLCLTFVAYFWDTWRVGSLGVCAALYLLVALVCWTRLRHRYHDSTPMFEATAAELHRDKEALMRSISDE